MEIKGMRPGASKFRGNGIGRTNAKAHARASAGLRASKSQASSHGQSPVKDKVPF